MAVVTVLPGGEQVFCPDDDTVLAALFAAGYSYTVGCRRGGCGICKVTVHEGTASHNRPVACTVVTPEEAEAGVRLSCRAVPAGDITIELHEGALRLVNPLLRQLNEKARARADQAAPSPTAQDTEQAALAGSGE